MPIKYSRIVGYKYRLILPYEIQTGIKPKTRLANSWIELGADGILWISAGYAWDGASGPAIDTKSFMRASLVHDALRQLMSENILDDSYMPMSDKILYDICIEDGMSRIRALWVLYGVSAARWYYKTPLAKYMWAKKHKILSAGK